MLYEGASYLNLVQSFLSADGWTVTFCMTLPAHSLRESMGVGADSNTKAFHASDINSFLKRPPVEIYRDGIDYSNPKNTNHIVLAVDPAGGGASAFTICSMVQQANGAVVVRSPPRLFPRLLPRLLLPRLLLPLLFQWPITESFALKELAENHGHEDVRIRCLA